MNILVLSEPSFPRHPGGAGKSTHVLAAELVRRGHRVSILCECYEQDEVEVIDGVSVHRLNTRAVSGPPSKQREADTAASYLRYVEEKLAPETLDLLYDSGGFLSHFFRLARSLKERFGTPYLLHYRYLAAHHRAYVERESMRASLAFANMELRIWETSQCAPARFANLVVCPSKFQAEFIDAHYRPVSGSAHVLPDPVELSTPNPDAVRELRARLAPPEAKLIYFGGRIDSDLKNSSVVARAFERVLAKQPNARLVVPVRGRLPKELGSVKKWIIELPWIKDRTELMSLLSAVDIGLVPSTYESFGLMCAELLAAGTPVIASPVGGMRDMIEDGKNGYLLERADEPEGWVEQVARRCLDLLESPELSSGLRDWARASASPYSIRAVGAFAEDLCRLAISSERLPSTAPPSFSAADQRRYASLLARYLGSAALGPAAEVLSDWPRSAHARCRECTRSSLASAYVDVVRLGRPLGRTLASIGGRYPNRVSSAVNNACPLGLVQRDFLRDAD